jgi:hypothetical protein
MSRSGGARSTLPRTAIPAGFPPAAPTVHADRRLPVAAGTSVSYGSLTAAGPSAAWLVRTVTPGNGRGTTTLMRDWAWDTSGTIYQN